MMATAEQLIDRLQLDLTRKSYSFTEYITMSSPYVPEGKEPMWRLLLRHRAEERDHARMLGKLIVSLGGIPNPGLFDEGAADTNYLSIFYLYDLLIKSKLDSISAFEERLKETDEFPDARDVVQRILEDERRQLSELNAVLAEYKPKPKAPAAPAKVAPVAKAAPAPAKPAAAPAAKPATADGELASQPNQAAPAVVSPATVAETPRPVTAKPSSDFDLEAYLRGRGLRQ